METLKISEGHQAVMPYLIVKNASGLLEFLKNVFDAVEKMKVPGESGGIMHAEASIHGATVMLADATDQFEPMPAGMFVYVENVDDVYARALQQKATSVLPPQDKDYGRTAGVLDPYGNTWWITAHQDTGL